ncbi:MAG: glycoside hydrolase family 3 N-terminal domain-containing protein [Alteraurantiacibacter sp.]
MMKRGASMAVIVAAALAVAGQPLAWPQMAVAQEQVDRTPEALLARMTLDEKIGQLVQRMGGRQRALNSRLGPDELERVRRGEVGSYLHVAGAEPLRELQRVAVEESRLRIPLLFSMDVVHGYRTIFPVPLAMAASWDPAMAELHARVAATEASAAGLHWTFAPMVDVARDPRWGRVVEGAGEDAYLGSRMGEAQVRGFQGDDLSAPDTIMAGTKHFGAYGAAEGGRDYAEANLSERSLRETYLAPFEAAAHAGTASYMTAFNSIGGVPTTANAALLRDMLRGEWGWQGLLLSDWRALDELQAHGVAENRPHAAALSLRAGVDMDMVADVYADELKAALEADPALLPLLDEAVLNVLRVKQRLGLFDHPYAYHDIAREAAVMLSPAHRAAARLVAERSIVLLKNEGNVLPLARDAGRIALIGALADDARSAIGSWKAQGQESEAVTLRAALSQMYPGVTYTPGIGPRDDDVSGVAAAVEAANASDLVVLVMGEDFDLTGEARSRSDLTLPGHQDELLSAIAATGKPLVVVLMGGRPLAIPEVDEAADAVLETWLLGSESGPAIARVLLGEVNPGGRLPMTFPRATGQVPFTYDQLPSGRPADADPTRDSTRYHDLDITPLYAFGHGLSYSRFAYGEAVVDRTELAAEGGDVTIAAGVTNTSAVAGDEVVQLYMRDPVASVSRPVMQLRGFQRITLQPGETKTVAFTLSAAQFALWGLNGGWVIEPGRIDLMIGAASNDIRSHAQVTVTGSAAGRQSPASIATRTSVLP